MVKRIAATPRSVDRLFAAAVANGGVEVVDTVGEIAALLEAHPQGRKLSKNEVMAIELMKRTVG